MRATGAWLVIPGFSLALAGGLMLPMFLNTGQPGEGLPPGSIAGLVMLGAGVVMLAIGIPLIAKSGTAISFEEMPSKPQQRDTSVAMLY